MAEDTVTRSISMSREELLDLLQGYHAFATLDGTTPVHLEKISNHSAERGYHSFTCILTANGKMPAQCKVKLSTEKDGVAYGDATYIDKLIFTPGRRTLLTGE